MSNKTYKVWLDTDIGVDDAQAILLGLKLPNIEIVGVSAVGGNVPVDRTFVNARNILSFADRSDIPVYKGSSKGLNKEFTTCEEYHGFKGIGEVELEESKAKVETKDAYQAIYEKAKELNGEMVIVAIGPLTNIAITIANHPDIVKYVKTIAIMGGAVVGGNATACAENNIYNDPEAAEVVFKSGIHVIMCGLDVTFKFNLKNEIIEKIASYKTKAATLLKDSTRQLIKICEDFDEDGFCIHDVAPLMYLAYPEMFKAYDCGIYVETQARLTLGKTVCDLYTDHKWEDRHCTVVMDVDHDKFVQVAEEIYKAY